MDKILKVSNMTKDFGGLRAVDNVSFEVGKGEFVGLIGPNGCGKSTLIKIIFGIATYYSGTVKHKGLDVSGWRTDQLATRGIAYVPQVDNVFPSLSVEENLQMGGNSLSTSSLNERIAAALEMFPDLKHREATSDVTLGLLS